MDPKQLRRLVEEALADIFPNEITINLEGEESDDIRILVVSNFFKGMNVTKRIRVVFERLDHLTTFEEYLNYSFTVNPLTANEKVSGVLSETQDGSAHDPSYQKIASSYQPRV